MNVKERAKYAWGRIVDLFKPKKPEIEVDIEEITEDNSDVFSEQIVEPQEEVDAENLSPSVPDRSGGEEAVPSRMTDEYKAWLAEQLEADESRNESDA
ncbi:MAG: hypothetical protein IJ237_01110 [Oscillospiraceae bacterium]|nr:hypothetical protein [Oscillospiraceae bacterium]